MKKRLSGFTLIETIIVMAIFSLIMYSVMQLMIPVTSYFTRSANFEDTTACLDNMRRCIEGNLAYADRIRVYAGYEPYQYDDADGDGILESSYAPSTELLEQVEKFYDDFFENRVCFDAVGSIYVLCFDNTQIVNDSALSTFSALSDYSRNECNQGKIVLYEFPYAHNSFTKTYTVDSWAVNQKLYGNFDYTFYLGCDGKADDGSELTGKALLDQYQFEATDCRIHISVSEVRRNSGGGLVRGGEDATYQNTYASFMLENALQYSDKEASYTKMSAKDMKLEYDANVLKGFKKFEPLRILGLQKSVIADAGSVAETPSFYFIFTTPDSTSDVSPTEWGFEEKITIGTGVNSGGQEIFYVTTATTSIP